MKKVLMLMASILVVANAAMADHIGVYGDQTGTSCNLANTGTVFVVHMFSAGTTGSRFKVDASASNTTVTFLNPTIGFVATGSAATDITVGYGTCLIGSGIVVGQLFLGGGSPSPTGCLKVSPAEAYPNVINIACDFQEISATGGEACFGGVAGHCPGTPVQSSTWGQVKALYR